MMSWSKAAVLSGGAMRRLVLASAALVMGGSAAGAAGWAPGQGGPAVQVQYRQDGYGRYQQDPNAQDPRRYEDQGDRYGRGNEDPRGGYGQDRGRRYEDRGGGGRGGSYQQSCGNVQQDGSTLSAVCRDGRGRQVETSIDLNRCGRSDIANNQGILQCGNVRGNGRRID